MSDTLPKFTLEIIQGVRVDHYAHRYEKAPSAFTLCGLAEDFLRASVAAAKPWNGRRRFCSRCEQDLQRQENRELNRRFQAVFPKLVDALNLAQDTPEDEVIEAAVAFIEKRKAKP